MLRQDLTLLLTRPMRDVVPAWRLYQYSLAPWQGSGAITRAENRYGGLGLMGSKRLLLRRRMPGRPAAGQGDAVRAAAERTADAGLYVSGPGCQRAGRR
jgi:hypothetical protein